MTLNKGLMHINVNKITKGKLKNFIIDRENFKKEIEILLRLHNRNPIGVKNFRHIMIKNQQKFKI